jgi:hypothetical protein
VREGIRLRLSAARKPRARVPTLACRLFQKDMT